MMRRGFTLLEVMIASAILAVGIFGILATMSQCNRMMMSSKNIDLAQYVIILADTAYPMPRVEDVTDNPLKNELLNIKVVDALEIAHDLEIELTDRERKDLETFTFERKVDDYGDYDDFFGLSDLGDEERLSHYGKIYTVRSIVRWGGKREYDKSKETVIRLWGPVK